jgi:hypothetical protein
MLTQPTTELLLRGIARDLNEQIAPDLQSESAKVALAMIVQLLNGCATRAAHEVAWMHDEADAIMTAVAAIDDPATVAAVQAFRAAPDDLHLDGAARRYHLAGEALAAAIEHAYASGNDALIATLRDLLQSRSAHEMEVVGTLELVGRG